MWTRDSNGEGNEIRRSDDLGLLLWNKEDDGNLGFVEEKVGMAAQIESVESEKTSFEFVI